MATAGLVTTNRCCALGDWPESPAVAVGEVVAAEEPGHSTGRVLPG